MVDRPSATAVFVARGVAFAHASTRLREVLPPRAGDLTNRMLERESAGSRVLVRSMRFAAVRAVLAAIQNFVSPGVFAHLAIRKRFIDDEVRSALGEGFTQVVVLGAGLDTLCMRLYSDYPDVTFLEIDHPASQASKLRLLPDGESATENLHFCAVDLALGDPAEAIASCDGFSGARPTVFVAEGLLMYLEQDDVEALLRALVRSAPGCRIVFTAMTLSRNGRPSFGRSSPLLRWWLRRKGEPFRWGIRPDDMISFLQPLGLTLQKTVTTSSLKARYLPGQPDLDVAEGEILYVSQSMTRVRARRSAKGA